MQMAETTHNTSLRASERYRNGKVQITLVWNSRNEKSSNSDKLDALAKEPLSWLVGSDVLVVDPPRKGLDKSLVDALQTISSVERKAKFWSESSSVKEKEEKRPWILRAREASVQIGSKTDSEESRSFPRTLIYISYGWESFKDDCKSLLSSKAWRLEKAHGFNFFPGTQSFEVLAVFKRGQAVGLKKKKKKSLI
ncbi:hypothetical protein EZV62_020109 [Acer yangbiense]|uniref:Uncharacterized protein n=1 Tax=Acer yangbiense TaxID=1000413 RepID=A0A5C7HCJ6_9ROSI|nr:hypothetical protein EZV62_020109 [Acer yangbiense]